MTFRLSMCIAIVGLAVGLWAQTPSGGSADQEAPSVTDRLNELQSESARLVEEARTLLAELRTLEAERDRQIRRVREAQAAIAESQASIERTAQSMLSLEAQRVAQLPAVETQLVDMYKRGRGGYAKFVLSVGGIREFGRAARAVAAMLRISRDRLTQHRATIGALAQERTTLEAELAARRAREAEARQARAAADRAVANRNAMLMTIDAQRDVNARLAGALQVEQERLRQREAARIAAAETSAVSKAPAPSSDPSELAALTPLAPLRGELLWPVSGRVTGRFARQVAATEDPAAANGVEIASREGNPVRALHSGTVSFAGPFGGFGNLVIVDHGGDTLSLYGYLGSISVRRDDAVQSGTELGRVGTAPSGEAVIFFEIRVDGRSVDPVQWLRPL